MSHNFFRHLGAFRIWGSNKCERAVSTILVCNDFFLQRAFTVGIGGPVGSGKTALVLSLCKHLRDSYGICVVTNDIFTR